MRLAFALLAVGALLAAAPPAQAGPSRLQRDLEAMVDVCEDQQAASMVETCFRRKLVAAIETAGSAATTLPRIDRFAHQAGGYLDQNCHLLMHWVGRRYALDRHVTLGQLQYVLPRSNDPGCSAGFAHGMLTALGPQVLRFGPQGALRACQAARTRYERYSCVHGIGHAYMRAFDEHVSLALARCAALGSRAPDCAQGVFHDYWLSVEGLDETRRRNTVTSPRRLCAAQQPRFVRPCWYRVYQELPVPRQIRGRRDLLAVCAGLGGIQRSGCVTAVSVVDSDDPFAQLRLCSRLAAADAADCVRGVHVQALAGRPLVRQVALVRGCSRLPAAARAACWSWLGRTLAVVTNGGFAAPGCGALAGRAQTSCRAGARRMDDALATFS